MTQLLHPIIFSILICDSGEKARGWIERRRGDVSNVIDEMVSNHKTTPVKNLKIGNISMKNLFCSGGIKPSSKMFLDDSRTWNSGIDWFL
jgi:hypothetical protein